MMTPPKELTEFELDGVFYRIGRLTAYQQFHLSRRLAPLIPPLVPIFMKLSQGNALSGDLATLPELLHPFADALSLMKDEDAEFVMGMCLGTIRRKTTQTDWVPIWNASGKVAMFDEFNDISTAIPMVIRVVQDSLGPFLRGALTARPLAQPTAA